jgi:NAD(P)H-dependent FMN reductase
MPHCLIVNGSLAGENGNTEIVLQRIQHLLQRRADVTVAHLALQSHDRRESWEEQLAAAQLLVFGTGTYWDQWGSPLQNFLEKMTPTEGTSLWLGKPTAVAVTMHSVGGKAIVSRLQGVLNTFGALLPPMSGIVLSAVAQAALAGDDESLQRDLWQMADLEILCHNLLTAYDRTNDWQTWPVDQRDFATRWIKQS